MAPRDAQAASTDRGRASLTSDKRLAVWGKGRCGMAGRDLIVMGTSAGGVETLSQVVRGFPASFPASVFIVCHFPSGFRSVLPEILSREGPLLASHPADGEPFYPGQIYIAPPDHHLLLGPDGRMRVTRGAREDHQRPAVDPLFRSAARYYGPRVVGVVLSGALHDGTAGLMAIRAAGGLAVVQDPGDARVAAMPRSAAQIAGADHVVPAAEMPPLLIDLVQQGSRSTSAGANQMDPIELMSDVVDQSMEEQARDGRRGDVSVFTCPDCGGALWQVDEPRLLQFRCHVGHIVNAETLLADQTDALEAALWTAVRTFREKSVLASQLANRERAEGDPASALRFEEQAVQAERNGRVIQRYLLKGAPLDEPGEGTLPAQPDPE
jgi:two-component system chemotaxis response regulator CheB